MKKSAWVLRLKKEISESEYNGRTLYFSQNGYDFLTNDLQKADVIHDKEKYTIFLKSHDEVIIKRFGKDAIRNFGWENISKNFDFVEVEVTE